MRSKWPKGLIGTLPAELCGMPHRQATWTIRELHPNKFYQNSMNNSCLTATNWRPRTCAQLERRTILLYFTRDALLLGEQAFRVQKTGRTRFGEALNLSDPKNANAKCIISELDGKLNLKRWISRSLSSSYRF